MNCQPPRDVLALWPPPPLGDWAERNMRQPIPIPGGDGFALPDRNNLNDLSNGISSPDSTDQGIGQPVDSTVNAGMVNARAERGVMDMGAYVSQTFNKVLNHVTTHSLGREFLYNWADAQFNVGGVTYPLDHGFGPGYHGDATVEMGNVQLYMRPGIWANQPQLGGTGKGTPTGINALNPLAQGGS